MRVGLIACVKSKQDAAAPAADLYTSALFRGGRAAVERTVNTDVGSSQRRNTGRDAEPSGASNMSRSHVVDAR
jgi:hypothetical protein